MSVLNVTLVAADGKLWEGEATNVIAPAAEGPMGILPGHAPILAALGDGSTEPRASSRPCATAGS